MKNVFSKMILSCAVIAAMLVGLGQAKADLITNGDFSAGYTGFTSGYTQIQPPYNNGVTNGSPDQNGNPPFHNAWPEGTYAIVQNPYQVHGYWTYGPGSPPPGGAANGNFLTVNGATNSSTGIGGVPSFGQNPFWQETVTGLTVGNNYAFSFYGTNNYPVNLASIVTTFGGLGTSTFALVTTGDWVQSGPAIFTATSSSLTISMSDSNYAQSGNDFSIDLISLVPFSGVGNPNLTAVPEPSSFALLGLGGSGLAFGAYRRRGMAVV